VLAGFDAEVVVEDDLGVVDDDSAAPAVDALLSSTTKGAGFSTTFVQVRSGDAGGTTAAATADLVFCTSLQHFEQNPPVAAFPFEN
jgi:hypothetical protein